MRLGPYEIVAPLGAGGMGEVYKSRDTRLDRTVAIKILHSPDATLQQRFAREARAISALDHPHICALYDVQHANGQNFLVMQYVEGETLAERLTRGRLPLEEALRYAIEIADALAHAHRHRIVHRDLKPANIMLTQTGVKLLDFGLAKMQEPAGQPLASIAITKTPGLTVEGTILGTLHYMAPEQLEGKEADARTDIFAFGAVLYELATGQRPFDGTSEASVIAAILDRDPPAMSSLVPIVPFALDRTVRKCLAKEPEKRWQAASDVSDELQWIAEERAQATASVGAPTDRARSLGRWGLVTMILLTSVVVTGVVVWNVRPAPSSPVRRSAISLPHGARFRALTQPSVAVSPDGEKLVYVATLRGVQQIFVRSMDNFEAKPIAGTDGGYAPFFSPDGESIGFFAAGKLKTVSVTGGTLTTLADAPKPWGATWGPNDTIVYAGTYESNLLQVPASGGLPQRVTTLDEKAGEVGHEYPEFLPGANAIVFTVPTETAPNWDDSLIEVQSLDTGKRRVLIRGGTYPRYVPTGHLVFIHSGTLMAVPFDLRRLEVSGSPLPVITGIAQSVSGVAQFSFSRMGTIAYIPGGPEGALRSLEWVDRTGTSTPLPFPPQPYSHPMLSPDGRRILVWITRLNCDAMVLDIGRETVDRLTLAGDNHAPTWTPDGKRIAFESRRKGGAFNLFWTPADASRPEERLAGNDHQTDGITSLSWRPDGKMLAYVEFHPDTGRDIWLLSVEHDRKARAFLQSASDEESPAFSPDGHWLAYVSNESGRFEVYVQPFPGPGEKWLISAGGGTEPVWNRNGRELFYRNGENMMAVEVTTQRNFTAGKPRTLFRLETPTTYGTYPNYDVSADGKRFLIVHDGDQGETQINVVVNWFEELKRQLARN